MRPSPAPGRPNSPTSATPTGKAIYASPAVRSRPPGRVAISPSASGAVNYFSEVRRNGRVLGTHEGGYLPFEFVDPRGHSGRERARSARHLPSGDAEAYPDYPFGEIPHGKQSWYGPPRRHLAVGEADRARQATRLACSDRRQSRQRRSCALALTRSAAAAGRHGARQGWAAFPPRTTGASLTLKLSARRPCGRPRRRTCIPSKLELLAGGEVVDTTMHSFGFRKIETRDGKFFLNGQPLYLRGALDQDYYPDGICTPPSLAFLEDQLTKAKHLGLNLLRVHIKVPDPRYYEVADRLGVLIWTELPNVQYFTAAAAQAHARHSGRYHCPRRQPLPRSSPGPSSTRIGAPG